MALATAHVSISSHKVAEPVFDHGNTIVVLENRLKQTEEVLAMERLAQRLLRVLSRWWEHTQLVLRNPLEQRVLSARRKLVNSRRRVEKVA